MSDLSASASSATASRARVVAASSPTVLLRIAEERSVATIWQRSFDPRIARDVAPALPRNGFEDGMLVWSHTYRSSPLDALVSKLAPSDGRDALLADMQMLLGRWFACARGAHAYVSLASVVGSSCNQLHLDNVGLRMLTTYAGAGTEWLSPGETAAWKRDPCCWRPEGLHRLETGHVVLMKGAAHPHCEGEGLVHRSPRHETGDAPRLLFRICDGEYHLYRPALPPLQQS